LAIYLSVEKRNGNLLYKPGLLLKKDSSNCFLYPAIIKATSSSVNFLLIISNATFEKLVGLSLLPRV
jgi:hypothetical protein